MPSTTSSWVSMVLDSSTVMTPSLPTFFMASAMILPMVSSLLAEMVPTWAIISPETGLDSLSSSPGRRLPSLSSLPAMMLTAFSMPRFRAIGLAPAATVFTPSRYTAWARTVAVVVPSPATSDVFEFDFLCYGDAVFGDGRRTEFLFDNYVAALGAECDLHSVGQKVDAAENRLTGFFSVNDVLCHVAISSYEFRSQG